MSKAIIICSSPNRNGKTNSLVKLVAEMMQKNNYEVVIEDIAHINYKSNGCIACMSCQKSDKFECAVKDEATPIMESLPSADILIYATPIYFMGPNAQLKLFLDRTFSLYKMEPLQTALKLNKLALIATADGDYDGGLNITSDTFKILADFSKIKFESLLIPFAEKIEHIQKDPDVVNKTDLFVKALLN